MANSNRTVGAARQRERNSNAMFVAEDRWCFAGVEQAEQVEREFRESGAFVRVTRTRSGGAWVVRGYVRNEVTA